MTSGEQKLLGGFSLFCRCSYPRRGVPIKPGKSNYVLSLRLGIGLGLGFV